MSCSAQDCLVGIRSFLRTYGHITSTLTGIGLASMVHSPCLGTPAPSCPCIHRTPTPVPGQTGQPRASLQTRAQGTREEAADPGRPSGG